MTSETVLDNCEIAFNYISLEGGISKLVIEKSNATYYGRACGDSLNEAGVFDGDILIIDRSADVENMNLIVAYYNGTFTCKILDINNRLLLSASPNYAPVPIKASDDFCIEGVVISSVRLFRKPNFYI